MGKALVRLDEEVTFYFVRRKGRKEQVKVDVAMTLPEMWNRGVLYRGSRKDLWGPKYRLEVAKF
jgi:hypothetical protein